MQASAGLAPAFKVGITAAFQLALVGFLARLCRGLWEKRDRIL